MRTASGLALAAIGAILAFAVTSQPPFLNLHVAGWVLMVVGVIGLVVPRRGYGWLRRRVVLREPGAGRPGQAQPGTPPAAGQAVGRRFLGRPGALAAPAPPASRPPVPGAGEPTGSGAVPYPAEETVEEFLEE